MMQRADVDLCGRPPTNRDIAVSTIGRAPFARTSCLARQPESDDMTDPNVADRLIPQRVAPGLMLVIENTSSVTLTLTAETP